MRILVVTQYFWPENFRINDLCVELATRGHEITVLTGLPNYPDGMLFPEYVDNRASYDEFNGCNVIRVPILPRGNGSRTKLTINYLSFAFMSLTLGMFRIRKIEFDLIFICQLSPVTIALPGIFAKLIYKKPVVMWVLDLWPDSLHSVYSGKSRLGYDAVGLLVSWIYKRCDLLLGQSKSFCAGIAQYTSEYSKIKYFPSWAEGLFLERADVKKEYISKDEKIFTLMFAGNIGEAQDFPSILSAAALLKNRGVKVQILVLGTGRMFEDVQSEIIEMGLEQYVIMLGHHPLSSMPSYYSMADVLLVSLRDSPAFSKTIPGKIQTYLAAGKPILTMLTGEGSRVVTEADCGLVADSGDYFALAENIILISEMSQTDLDRLGRNAYEYANREFDRTKLVSQLEGWFQELTDQGFSSRTSV